MVESKQGYSQNTKVTMKFKISRIMVYNQHQQIVRFCDSGTLDANGYLPSPRLVGLHGGNDNIRNLFVMDDVYNRCSCRIDGYR